MPIYLRRLQKVHESCCFSRRRSRTERPASASASTSGPDSVSASTASSGDGCVDFFAAAWLNIGPSDDGSGLMDIAFI